MLIRIAFDITVSAPSAVPVLLALSPRPEEMARISAGPMRIEPAPAPVDAPTAPAPRVEPRWSRDGFGNARLVMPAGRHRLLWGPRHRFRAP